MTLHGDPSPLVENLLHVGARAARLQAQRVADEIGLLTLAMAWQVEFGSQRGERVGVFRGRSYTLKGKPVVPSEGGDS